MAQTVTRAQETPAIGITRPVAYKTWWRADWILAAPFLLPAFIFYTLFLIVPLLGTAALSFTEWSGINFANVKFIGLTNYRAMGDDPIFWLSLQHNVIFLVGAIVLRVSVALFLALALDERVPFSRLFGGS